MNRCGYFLSSLSISSLTSSSPFWHHSSQGSCVSEMARSYPREGFSASWAACLPGILPVTRVCLSPSQLDPRWPGHEGWETKKDWREETAELLKVCCCSSFTELRLITEHLALTCLWEEQQCICMRQLHQSFLEERPEQTAYTTLFNYARKQTAAAVVFGGVWNLPSCYFRFVKVLTVS